MSVGFVKSKNEQGMSFLNSMNDKLIFSVYVDDLIITGANENKVEKFKKKIMFIFGTTDLGLLSSYLGIKVHQGEYQLTLSQEPYIAHIWENFQVVDCNLTKNLMETHLKMRKDASGRSVDTMM